MSWLAFLFISIESLAGLKGEEWSEQPLEMSHEVQYLLHIFFSSPVLSDCPVITQGSVSRPQQYQGETVQGVQFNFVLFSFYHTEGRGSAMER